MAEKDWAAILKDEDRIIANSDRRFRYHCYSLESMSEELTYKERSIYIQDDCPERKAGIWFTPPDRPAAVRHRAGLLGRVSVQGNCSYP